MSKGIIQDPSQPVSNDFLQALKAEYGNPDGDIQVPLLNGPVLGYEFLTFRNVRSSGELADLQQRAAQFAKANMKATKKEWRAMGEFTPVDLATAFTLSELSVAPKLDQGHVLFLCLETPWLVEYITGYINARRMRYMVEAGQMAKVEDEKKD